MRPDWADENVKILATLTHLSTSENKKTFTAAKKKYIDDEDCYLSDAFRDYLLAYPLDDTALSSIRDLDEPYKNISALIPQFDGEEDPFSVAEWSDLAKLPKLTKLSLNASSALPGASDVASHPSLAELTVSIWSPKDKHQYKEIIELCKEANLNIEQTIGHSVILRRGALTAEAPALLSVLDALSMSVQRARKGGFQLDINGARFVKDQLVATVRLWRRDATGNSLDTGAPTERELLILPRSDASAKDLEKKLKARAKEISEHFFEKGDLPS